MATEITHVLCPVDGSEGACRAAAFAAGLARCVGARLTLLHVHPLSLSEVLGLRSVDEDELADIKSRVAKMAFDSARRAIEASEKNAAKKAGKKADAGGLDIDELVALGDPAKEVVDRANAMRIGLIVMGTRGLSPMRELLLGSVSDKVLRHAPCAVTIIR